MNKWIGAFLGALNGGILNALAGFAIGAFIDSLGKSSGQSAGAYQPGYGNRQNADYNNNGERNGFLFTLMVLAAHVIQADGRIMHSEMECLRQFLQNNFGSDARQQGNDIVLRLFEYRKQRGDRYWHEQIDQALVEVSQHMPVEHRLQILAFLSEIAKADGHVSQSERDVLCQLANGLGFSSREIDELLSMGGASLDDDYKVLGITPDATDEEVRKAYKKMALKYHPDRVATLGDDVKAAAQRKFQEVNNAKERIFKSRNM